MSITKKSSPVAVVPAAPAANTTPSLDEARAAVAQAEKQVNAVVLEREVAVRLMLLAPIAGLNVLMLGPPGTAKSLAVRAILRTLILSGLPPDVVAYFEVLLMRSSEVDEVFGPLDFESFQRGETRRNTDGMLPKALFGFLDEVFRGNSAILNALLTLLNERHFANGRSIEKSPLRAVYGATNFLGEGAELEAIADRFHLRIEVPRPSDAVLRAIVGGRNASLSSITPCLSLDHLDVLRDAAAKVTMPSDVEDAIVLIDKEMRGEGKDAAAQGAVQPSGPKVALTPPSGRRWGNAAALLRAVAALDGRTAVSVGDLSWVAHVLWDRPEQIPAVKAIVRKHSLGWVNGVSAANKAVDEKVAAARAAVAKGDDLMDTMAALNSGLREAGKMFKSTADQYGEVAEVKAVIARVGEIRAALASNPSAFFKAQ